MFCPHCGTENSEGYNYCRQCGKPLAIGTAQQVPTTQRVIYAGFWMRFVAHLIDQIVLSIPSFFMVLWVVIYSLSWASVMEDLENIEDISQIAPFISMILLITFIGICIDWLYHALMESSSWQATLGKRALGIKVTDMDGNRISFMRASGRHFGKIISGLILSIGYIMAGFTQKKQALHDMMANTLVVRSY